MMLFASQPAGQLPILRNRLSLFLQAITALLLPAAARARGDFAGGLTSLGSGFTHLFVEAVDSNESLWKVDGGMLPPCLALLLR